MKCEPLREHLANLPSAQKQVSPQWPGALLDLIAGNGPFSLHFRHVRWHAIRSGGAEAWGTSPLRAEAAVPQLAPTRLCYHPAARPGGPGHPVTGIGS
jgi:hypothetical protein